MSNQAIAVLLRQIADLLDYQGVAFKPAAYRRAAQTLDDAPADVMRMDKKQLMAIPGIGQAIAEKILDYQKQGFIPYLTWLKAEVGPMVSELIRIEDLGPKRVKQIREALGIDTVDQLILAAEQGKLRNLPRFSELMEKKILENARRVTQRNHRFPREQIKADADALAASIRSIPGVVRAEAAGSFRREKPTIGDLDIVVTSKARKGKDSEALIAEITERVVKLPIVARVVAKGPTKVSFDLTSDLRVDIRFVEEAQWGSAMLYFTGDKEHNIALRKRAIERGWKLSEYGLFAGEKVIASKEEADVYKALQLPSIEPKKRTGELG